jgi:hypothetical protein
VLLAYRPEVAAGGLDEKLYARINMKWKYIFLALAIVCLAIGVGAMVMGHGQSSMLDMIQGGFKGLAGVFFILYYILVLIGKEPSDKTGAEHF